MNVGVLVKQGTSLLSANSHTILTAVGVAGTIGTAYLAGKASFKAAKILDRVEVVDENDEVYKPLKTQEKAQLVWKHYIPPVLVGAATIGVIIGANRVAAHKIAALAVASGVTERAFQEYKDKVAEKLTKPKLDDIQDSLAQDRVNNTSGSSQILLGTGEVLCFDELTGRYFQSNMETLRRAENTINFEILNHDYASLSQFYDEIGLAATAYSDTVGWNLDNRCEMKISTVMSTDNRPCAAIDFHAHPSVDYVRRNY